MAVPLRPDAVNILVVDDQPAKLLTYDAILTELGEKLIRANSASEALEALLKHEIAVVLVDVCMPDLDGYELAAMIRQHPRCQKTSIIFVSAVMMTELDRLRGYESGAVDYVPVPVVPEILRAKVSIFAELYRKTRALERAERRARAARRRAHRGARGDDGGAARGRPAQGRVPGDAGARAAQPAGADPHRGAAAAAQGAARGAQRPGPRHHRSPGRAPGHA